MDRPDQVYPEIQQGPESCQVQGPNCLGRPSVRIHCHTEGTSLISCQACLKDWRRQVQESQFLSLKCPNCAHLHSAPAPATVRQAAAIPLSGDAAREFDRAMHSEGITIDVRQRVLHRLYVDAFWLSYAHPQPAGQHHAERS